MATTTMELAPAGAFRFAETAYSHGWVVLAPNAWDPDAPAVHRVHRLGSGRVLRLRATGAAGGAAVRADVLHRGPLSGAEEREIRSDVRRMFRLDEDLSGFHARCRRRGGRWAAVADGLGRLLRSPTVWEDAVKTICTTNIQWSGTKRMVRGLVGAFGDPVPGASDGTGSGDGALPPPEGTPDRAFPAPEALAAATPDELAERAGLGYRAPWVHALAREVAAGERDLERWRESGLSTPELARELKTVKGIGDYAAATLLMLLGRYDELAVDSVFRRFVGETYFDGAAPSETEARAVYEDWGEWKFLAYWFDLWQGTEEEL